jgi:Phage integrase, N-terminal SAM-like domain
LKLRELHIKTFIEPSPITVNDYLIQWLKAGARPKLTQSGFDHYRGMLRLYVRPVLEKKKLAEVRPPDMQAPYSYMLKHGFSFRMRVVLTPDIYMPV